MTVICGTSNVYIAYWRVQVFLTISCEAGIYCLMFIDKPTPYLLTHRHDISFFLRVGGWLSIFAFSLPWWTVLDTRSRLPHYRECRMHATIDISPLSARDWKRDGHVIFRLAAAIKKIPPPLLPPPFLPSARARAVIVPSRGSQESNAPPPPPSMHIVVMFVSWFISCPGSPQGNAANI